MPSDPQDELSAAEREALAGWPLTADAHVVRSEVISPDAIDVIVDTEPGHEMRLHMRLEEGRWTNAGEIVE